MKLVYILIVLVVASLALGCLGNKQAEPKSAVAVVTPGQTVSPVVTGTPGIDDPFDTDMDVAALDSMLADSSMDISLTEMI